MPQDDFVHLHVHTEFSMLDGLSRIPHLVQRAVELGQPALAITDHGVMHGVIDFYREARKAGIKPIIGMEGYLARRGMRDKEAQKDNKPYHLLLIARNLTGYLNLMKIATAAQLEGFYYKPRVDKEYLAQHAEGLIVTSGCAAAEIPRLLEEGREREAIEAMHWYRDVFGPENFFLELQSHSMPWLDTLNRMLIEFSKKYNIPLLATNDVHYVRPEDARYHDVLLCVQTGKTYDDPGRLRMSDESYYLKSRAEMEMLFREAPEALNNSLLVAEMCELDLDTYYKGYHLPHFPVPEGHTAETYLRHLCETGLRKRYGDRADDPEVRARLEHELNIIHQMGFDAYFLIVWDLCQYAKQRDIWWNVRGSGAGSIVAYSLGITSVDPLRYHLIFERFLNPERVSMPDIDLDFPDDRREEMIQYAVDKYGQENVAQIITFGTMGARAVIRDVGRALGIPLDEVDRIAKMVPFGPKVKLKDSIETVPELKEMWERPQGPQGQKYKELLDIALHLEGMVRHASTHAAGVVISDKPLVNYTPLHRPTREGAAGAMTQFDMKILESLGLLKVDFLGLATLTIMRRASELIEERHGERWHLGNIPLDDPETYKLLSSGEVTGVFQVESEGMRRVLRDMRPSKFEHVIALISLYRPGPMEYIPKYIARMHGKEEVTYRHPKLEPILAETYGIIVYQEQIMQIATQLAGYRPGEADMIRKAVGKKLKDKLLAHRKKFVEGCVANDIPRDVAESIFDDIEFFARYGFNKCLPGDVEVVDAATGRLVRVEDLYAGRARIDATVSLDTDTLTLTTGNVIAVMDNGVKPVYRLRTALGHEIEATANHPFYTFDGWRHLEDLRPGDMIAVPRRLPVEGRERWPTNKIIALAKHVVSQGLAHIPEEVFTFTNDRLRIFMDCLWEMYGEEGTTKQISLSSKQSAYHLQHLLLRLGILSRIHVEQDSNQSYRYTLQILESTSRPHPSPLLENLYVREGPAPLAPLPINWERGKGQGERGEGLKFAHSFKSSALRTQNPEPLSLDNYDIDIYWDEVVSIEYVGEKRTYDLTVEDHHNFIANNIVVHNSHATDYAKITVQTAFLKAHYPVEYMTALLEVELDKQDKVTNFIIDARRMGIEVLPPDINKSQLAFTIEELPEDDPRRQEIHQKTRYPFPVPPGAAIRFGLAAVKNVGVGPVEAILQAREEGGPFTSLEDFCRRVDLRKVNRKALECLIKVGAFDQFGNRAQLLEAIDKMIAYSVPYHKAREAGQISIFDLLGESEEEPATPELELPDVPPPSTREMLGWEKELLGVYVTAHPLERLNVNLADYITEYAGLLNERYAGRNVRTAGIVQAVRPYITKNKDRMAFVTLEDMHGTLDVVVFPRVYKETQDFWQEGKVVIVDGRVEQRGDKVNLIADRVQDYVENIQPRGEAPPPVADAPPPPPAPVEDPYLEDEEDEDDLMPDLGSPPDMGPLPVETVPTPPPAAGDNGHPTKGVETAPLADVPAAEREGESASQTARPETYRAPVYVSTGATPAPQTPDVGLQPRQIRVVLRRTGDIKTDRRHLAEVFDLLKRYRGQDRFMLIIPQNGGWVEVDFPNERTGWCESLEAELTALVGVERIDVRPWEGS